LIKIAWHGHYLDGKTANKQQAEIQLLNEGLRITISSGSTYLWPYSEIRQTQGFYKDEPVQLERGGKIPELVIIADHDFLTSMHKFAPHPAKRFHNPAMRGLRLRLTLLAAAGIVAAGVFFYVWGIPLLAKTITPYIPLDWEKGLGESALNILAPEEGRCKNPQLQKAVDEIVTRLNAADPGTYSFKVYVTKSTDFNAVALPGGNIVVFRGLLEKTETPEALAGVLAHEMQHVKKRHVTKRIIEDSSTGLIISAISGDVTGAMLYGVKAAHTLALLSYSRQDEEEADTEGVKMMMKANLDPSAMIRFFEVMKEEDRKMKIPQYLSTHPDLDKRIDGLKTIIARSKPSGKVYTKLSSENNWDWLRKKCALRGKTPLPR